MCESAIAQTTSSTGMVTSAVSELVRILCRGVEGCKHRRVGPEIRECVTAGRDEDRDCYRVACVKEVALYTGVVARWSTATCNASWFM
jgi:hypothetical protein